MSVNPAYNKQRHRKWSEEVLRRDKYLCQDCKRYGRMVPADVAHHIIPLSERPDLAYKVSNGVALCNGCHSKRHPEKGGRH
ncbi:MAG: HNH endonuclease [Eubacteriales bacterium]|nr:HNH endonuclease [Eubacteriales bacterium]